MSEEVQSSGEAPGFELESYGDQGPASTGPRMLIPLFLVPLLIVAVVVGLFLGISALIGDAETPEQLIDRVALGGVNDRWQAAASLADLARTDPAQLQQPELQAELRRAFERSSNYPELRTYLSKIFALLGDHEAAPMVRAAMREIQAAREEGGGAFPGKPEETGAAFVEYILCLGALEDQESEGDLLALANDADRGIRMTTALALGQIYLPLAASGGPVPPAVLEGLGRLHQDEDPWVRMNAAQSLAKLGSEEGLPTLEFMLDRQNLRKSGLQFPDEAAYTVATYDPAFDPIRYALASIQHLVEVSPDRASLAADDGPLVATLEGFVEREPNPALRAQGEQVLKHLREGTNRADNDADSGVLRDS